MTTQVKSFTSDKFYTVTVSDATHKAIACNCGDYTHRGQLTGKACKHIVSHEENRKANLRMMEAGY